MSIVSYAGMEMSRMNQFINVSINQGLIFPYIDIRK